jgi:SDR family mycofactocin-dependent oxidoreductase
MLNKLEGRVAFITGAARGQGRSHAVRLAQEGADIIAVDLCGQIETVPYPMATPEDLVQTVNEVEALGLRIVARQADVRDLSVLKEAVTAGTAELGPVNIIVANAGISCHGAPEPDIEAMFRSTIEVNLVGAWNTVMAAAPSMIENGQGGAIVLISSTQGLKGTGGDGSAAASGYAVSKHGVVGLMRTFANWLAKYNIRVNTVHPTGVPTPMIMNEHVERYVAENPEVVAAMTNLLPVDFVQPIDISNAISWLVSDDARYVTGVTLPVDAGFNAK